MRLNQKRIEEVIHSILGEEGKSLIKELQGRENISEFDLANKTKKDIKVIRKMLYLLYNHNLVGFIRKKDKQKGWYIYYWTLLPESILFFYIKKKRELLEKLKSKLSENNRELFFACKNNCVRLNFDQAMDFEFHCPECGELVSQDQGEEAKQIKKKIAEMEEELSSVERKERRRPTTKDKKSVAHKKKLSLRKNKLKKREKG